MPIYIDGPAISTPLTAFQYNLYGAIPADHAFQDVIGIMWHNDTPWELYITGYSQSLLRLRPNAEVYIPNFSSIQLPNVINITPKNSAVFGVGGYKLSTAHLNFTLFFQGEDEPPLGYITDFAANLSAAAGPTPLIEVTFLAGLANTSSTTAHTVVLQAFFPDLTSPLSALFLTHLSYFFGVPTVKAGGDCTITDNGGNQWLDVHLDLGVAPTPGYQSIFQFTNPPKTFPNLGNGIASWTWTQPAMTNGPGYSINMMAYSR